MHIESDERGFYLVIGDAPPILIDDPERLYDSVKGQIGPWLRERDEALYGRSDPLARRAVFACDPDESAGAYELSDPKHPDFHSVHADIYDTREEK